MDLKQRNEEKYILASLNVKNTNLVKKEILARMFEGYQVFIIDPEQEYKELVEKLGLESVKLTYKSDECFNSIDIKSDI
jgi:hypothetical protein